MPFSDRRAAGRALASRLAHYAGRPDVVILALPRGGVLVGAEVARALGAPMDVFVVRKLGVPGREELAMGAVASGGVVVLNEGVLQALGLSELEFEEVAAREQAELERRERIYREGRSPVDVIGKIVIIVDDGLATGATMRAAIEALRTRGPARLIAAVPVGAADTCKNLGRVVDELICAETPEFFIGVGRWYADFSQTSDDEVRAVLGEVVGGSMDTRFMGEGP
jgi:predicted phosphoribosyltransferase